MPQIRRRQDAAVYLCRVPDDWRPDRVWTWPPQILSAELAAKNLPMRDALAFARTLNLRRIQEGTYKNQPVGEWAVVSRTLKTRPRPAKPVLNGEILLREPDEEAQP